MIIKLYIVRDSDDTEIDSWMVVAQSIDSALDNATKPPEFCHIEYKVIWKG